MSRSSDRIWEHDSLCEVRDQSGLPTTEIDSGCLTFSSPEGREFRPREATGESLIDVQKLARMLGFEPLTSTTPIPDPRIHHDTEMVTGSGKASGIVDLAKNKEIGRASGRKSG